MLLFNVNNVDGDFFPRPVSVQYSFVILNKYLKPVHVKKKKERRQEGCVKGRLETALLCLEGSIEFTFATSSLIRPSKM